MTGDQALSIAAAEARHAACRLMGAAEIRALLNLSPSRAYAIMRSQGFPEPVDRLSVGRIWRAEDVEKWIREHRPQAP